jgi:MtN3 and saliva related transmembrane protein
MFNRKLLTYSFLMQEVIAYLAAICTTVAFVPQAIMVWKTRNTVSISFVMYMVFITGLALWTVYGVMTWQMPIMVANVVTIILASSILLMKVNNMIKGEGK